MYGGFGQADERVDSTATPLEAIETPVKEVPLSYIR